MAIRPLKGLLGGRRNHTQPPHWTGRVSLRVNIATVFSILALLISIAITWYGYRENSRTALVMADKLMAEAGAKVIAHIQELIRPAATLAEFSPVLPGILDKPDGETHPVDSLLMEALDHNRYLYSAYVGYGDGDFHQIISLNPDRETPLLAFIVPRDARFALRTILRQDDDTRIETWLFLNAAREPLGAHINPNPTYDPRERPWYQQAITPGAKVVPSIYAFESLTTLGLTYARKLDSINTGVFGIDVTLEALSELLAQQPVSANGQTLVIDGAQQIIAFQDTSRLLARLDSTGTRLRQARLSELGDSVLSTFVSLVPPTRTDEFRALFTVNGADYVGVSRPLRASFAAGGMVAIVAPVSDFIGPIEHTRQNSLIFALAAVAVAVLLVVAVAGRMSSSIEKLVVETEKIERFELRAPIMVSSHIIEIDKLAHALAVMKQTLGTFGQYVPKELVRRILASGLAPQIGGRRQDITLMFTDIENFSTLAETLEPEELMARTSRYFNEISAAIAAHGGVIDKYIGDSVMALWNAPISDPDHAANACAAALACRSRLEAFNHSLAAQGISPINTRIGVHMGEAVVGNVGSDERINYTAVGATVNLASRIEGLNKMYGTAILVSSTVAQKISGQFALRYVDLVRPVGSKAPIEVYELLSEGHAPPDLKALLSAWDTAMTFWRQRLWHDAQRAFAAIAAGRDDPVARLYVARCRDFLETPPPADWNGVTVPVHK